MTLMNEFSQDWVYNAQGQPIDPKLQDPDIEVKEMLLNIVAILRHISLLLEALSCSLCNTKHS